MPPIDQSEKAPPRTEKQKMNSNQEIDDLKIAAENAERDESLSVDDFIRQLEAREKDLHITADTTIIEIEQGFDDANPPEFIKDGPSTDRRSPDEVDCSEREKNLTAAAGNDAAAQEIEIAALREKLTRSEEERAELLAISQRRARDFENFKIRAERDREENFRTQTSEIAAQLVPVLDNLQRALDFAAKLHESENGEFRRFFEGITLVNKQLSDIFSSIGIEPISAVGQKFDPHLHEAAVTEQTNEFPPNTVSAELLRGYKMGDLVIRHSMVKVAVAPLGAGRDEDLNSAKADSHNTSPDDAPELSASENSAEDLPANPDDSSFGTD